MGLDTTVTGVSTSGTLNAHCSSVPTTTLTMKCLQSLVFSSKVQESENRLWWGYSSALADAHPVTSGHSHPLHPPTWMTIIVPLPTAGLTLAITDPGNVHSAAPQDG